MVRIFRHYYVPLPILMLLVADAGALVLSAYVGIHARYVVAGGLPHDPALYAPRVATFVVVAMAAMIAFGLYQRRELRDVRTVLVRVGTMALATLVALALVYYLAPTLALWRSAALIAITLGATAVAALRVTYTHFGRSLHGRRRVLVVGAGPRAAQVSALAARPHASFRIAGFVATPGCQLAVPAESVVSGLDSLVEFARHRNVDEVVVALEDRRGVTPVAPLLACRFDGLTVTAFTTFWEREVGRVDLDSLSPSWLIFSDGFAAGGIQFALKRVFDVVVSLAVLAATAPMLIAAAVAIRLDSRGPILYRQERVGRGGVPFMLLKFRSMRVDAEHDGVPQWSGDADPRVTRVGAFLRRTRIDEIPQAINVLRGDMSFVGPRPERPYFVERLAAEIPFYRERHRVKPGITGWAQISYRYGASTEDARRKLEYDLYYLKNFGLLFDLLILMQTARVVLWPQSAGAEIDAAVEADRALSPLGQRPAA